MKHLEWKDEYLLGIPAVDLQHQRIFDCFVTIAGGSSEHDRLLAEFAMAKLVRLLQEHFALEESMMRTLCYPGLDLHVEEHRQFHADVHHLAQSFIRTKGSVSHETIAIAQNWLRGHILVSDRHYLDFFSASAHGSVSSQILLAQTEIKIEPNSMGAMKIEVPDSVKQQTTKCPHDFGCLASGHCGDRKLCAAEYSYGGNTLRIASDDTTFCPYHLTFGFGQLCTCPVRDYLHTKGHSSIG